MKLLRRLGKFLNKFEAETTATIVVLFVILLLVELFQIISGTKFLELLPSIATIVSALLLFMAFRQSVLGNRMKQETVVLNYYMDVIKNSKEIGLEEHNLMFIHKLNELEPLIDYRYKYFKSSTFLIKVFSSKVFQRTSFSFEITELYNFMNRYLEFFSRLSFDMVKVVDSRLLDVNETDLLKRYTEMFSDFVQLAVFLEKNNFIEENLRSNSLAKFKNSHIIHISKVYYKIKPYLRT